MTETPRNAIDTDLIKLNLASQYLEITRPSKTDVKKAGEASEDASDILKACLVLLDHDCYSVQDPPQGLPTPLFKPDGQPQAEAEIPTETGLRTVIDVEVVRTFKVNDRVKATASAGIAPEGAFGTILEDDGSAEDESPYYVTFDNNQAADNGYLNAADLEPLSEDDETRAEPFPQGTPSARKKVFKERLDTLEEIFCERLPGDEPYGKQLKLFKPHREAWLAAWEAADRATWPKLLAAIVEANKIGNEFTSWAPAA
jgi:hypothetical protein